MEFRRYRLGTYIVAALAVAGGVAWMIASVAHSLFSHPEVRSRIMFSGKANDIDAQLDCQHEVSALFTELNHKSFELPKDAALQDFELVGEWEAFSRSWKQRWRQVGVQCRFNELAGRGIGAGYDRLAVVHEQLELMQRAYSVLIDNYLSHHASRVDELRHSLKTSREEIERQRPKTPPG